MFILEPLGCSPSCSALQDKLGSSSNCSSAVTREHCFHFVIALWALASFFYNVIGSLDATSLFSGLLIVPGTLEASAELVLQCDHWLSFIFRPTAGQAVYCRVLVSIDLVLCVQLSLSSLLSVSWLIILLHLLVFSTSYFIIDFFLSFCFLLYPIAFSPMTRVIHFSFIIGFY